MNKTMIEIAVMISSQSPCSRAKVGAIIFREDRKTILSTGFNGQARKSKLDLCNGSTCKRNDLNIPSGEQIEVGCIHAEMNAISNAAFEGIAIEEASILVTAPPCLICSKLIIQSGLKKVYFVGGDRWINSGLDYLKENNIELIPLI
jgi:dCMP deaminase